MRADCATCKQLGYRSCDRCAGVVFERARKGRPELCEDCIQDNKIRAAIDEAAR